MLKNNFQAFMKIRNELKSEEDRKVSKNISQNIETAQNSVSNFESGAYTFENNSEDEINVQYIDINNIKPNPYQPRKFFTDESLEELSASIIEHGIMQPITVRLMADDSYELIAGERRLRASKIAKKEKIPAIILEANEEKSAVLALLENLQREDLNYMEEAKGYISLIKEHGFTQEKLARKIGKSQSTIANKIRILKLSDNIKSMLIQNDLSERHARALLRICDEKTQEKILKIIIDKSYNVKRSEELIDAAINKISDVEYLPKSSNSGKITRIVKDLRLFVNTIKQSVEIMRNSGINAKATQIDRGDYIEFIIRVPKKPNVNLNLMYKAQ